MPPLPSTSVTKQISRSLKYLLQTNSRRLNSNISRYAPVSFFAGNNPFIKKTKTTKTIKPITFSQAQKLARLNILGNGTPQKFESRNESDIPASGFIFNTGWKPTRIKSPQEILELNQDSDSVHILIPGLGGTIGFDAESQSATRLYQSYYPFSKIVPDEKKLITYSSANEGETRFKNGQPYYFNPNYIISDESEIFFERMLKPLFFDETEKLKDPEEVKNLYLIGYSIGFRESRSAIMLLQKKLATAIDDLGWPKSLLKNYMEKVYNLNIGSPVNFDPKISISDEDLLRFKNNELSLSDLQNLKIESKASKPVNPILHQELSFLSARDFGTAKPLELAYLMFNSKNNKITEIEGQDQNSRLFICGTAIMSEFIKDTSNESAKVSKLGHDPEPICELLHSHFKEKDILKKLFSSDLKDLVDATRDFSESKKITEDEIEYQKFMAELENIVYNQQMFRIGNKIASEMSQKQAKQEEQLANQSKNSRLR